MTAQRDYILRQIEMLGSVLRRIRELILGGGTRAAAEELTRVARQGGVDLALGKALAGESLLALLSTTGELDIARCVLLAELLYLDGLRAREEGAAVDARASFAKALLLFEAACNITPVVGTPEVRRKMEELKEWLA